MMRALVCVVTLWQGAVAVTTSDAVPTAESLEAQPKSVKSGGESACGGAAAVSHDEEELGEDRVFLENSAVLKKNLSSFATVTDLAAEAKPTEAWTTSAENAWWTSNSSSRRLQTCTPWADAPFDPSSYVAVDSPPWGTEGGLRACKMWSTYANGETYVCSGSLVGPYHFLTARHCGFNPCRGEATVMRVACGYGYLEDADDYAHYGSAFGNQFVYYDEYDDSTTCGSDARDVGLDIMLLRLDRAIGDNVGWYGMTAATITTNLNVRGYPGYDPDLLDYIPFAHRSQLYRKAELIEDDPNDTILVAENEIIFPGESGGPWYTDSLHVAAVHSGGPGPCTEVGANVDDVWLDAYRAKLGQPSPLAHLTAWTDPPDYCHLIRYQSDIYDFYSGRELLGVGPSAAQLSRESTFSGAADFYAGISLFNVGNVAASYTIQWGVRQFGGTIITVLDVTTHEMPAWSIRRLTNKLPVTWDWPTTMEVVADWSDTTCYTDDGDWASLGYVRGYNPPTSMPTPAPTPKPTVPAMCKALVFDVNLPGGSEYELEIPLSSGPGTYELTALAKYSGDYAIEKSWSRKLLHARFWNNTGVGWTKDGIIGLSNKNFEAQAWPSQPDVYEPISIQFTTQSAPTRTIWYLGFPSTHSAGRVFVTDLQLRGPDGQTYIQNGDFALGADVEHYVANESYGAYSIVDDYCETPPPNCRALVFDVNLPGGSEYELQIPLSSGPGTYELTARAKYSSNFAIENSDDRKLLHARFWNNTGVGWTKDGIIGFSNEDFEPQAWPTQPDVYENISIHFTTQSAPTRTIWYLGYPSTHSAGRVFITDLQLRGPDGTLYIQNGDFTLGADVEHYIASESYGAYSIVDDFCGY